MDIQTEYLLNRDQIPRGQITRRLFTLGIFIVLAYIAIWYFWPTSNLANLPYCVGDLLSGKPLANDRPNSLNEVYVSPETGPRMDNFALPFAHFLRFNANGKVMYAAEVFNYQFNWRAMSVRFNWLYFDSTVFVGEYKITDDRIQFTTTRPSDNLYIDWTGTIVDRELLLDSTFYYGDTPLVEALVFKLYNVEQCPFGNK